jgi:exodeoxyribonuclease V alpha subunit
MTEITNISGYTIHRLLGFIPGQGFQFNKNNPLYEDIIIVDEVSMIGGYLFYSLIQAVKNGAKLVMLADIGQLESIGVLNVASDIINSGKTPVVRLDKIHRQAQKSAIITESIKVRNGVQLCDNSFSDKEIRGELQDLELDIYLNKDKTAQKVIEKFKENLPKVNNIMDIQVILPMKTNGKSSTFNINQELQNIYNPYYPSMKEIEISHSKNLSYKLRINDKVMNTRNNYKTVKYNPYSEDEEDLFNSDDDYQVFTPIFNGNLGIIKGIYSTYMIIDFYTIGEIIVPQKHWKYIELGYAATCHKFQGSQSPIVIIGLDFNAYMLLTKEWVYTALTRAQEYCVLCAENKALRYAISHNGVSNKKTHLKDMLENYGAIKMKDY